MSLGRTLYRTVTRVAHPFLGALVSHRVRTGKEDRQRTAERFARGPAAASGTELVWMHGASIGETKLLLALAEQLIAQRPSLKFLITSQTRTSAELIAKAIDDSADLREVAAHQFAPIDTPAIAKRFVDHWAPSLGVFAEGEIWPNLILEASAKGVPLALINARMTERSVTGWDKWPGFARSVFSSFDAILAADAQTAKGLQKYSGRPILVPGNLKASLPPQSYDEAELDSLKERFAGNRQVLAAISTHSGEEAFILDAAEGMDPSPALILVPRHPERAGEIADLLKSRSKTFSRRSTGQAPATSDDVLLADTLGEVGLFTALSDTVYLGGGHARGVGGHNPIEILQAGKPVLTGPDLFNFDDVVSGLRGKGGLQIVDTPQALAAAFPAAPPSAAMQAYLDEQTRAPMDATVAALMGLLEEDEVAAGAEGQP
ncbi:MAG: glycosyltransferase N-terminal domain-containing protein [Henriciella sp.]|uniref:3-deoxy-D-manno-octulosonic acid transferase n=1 Tax=Henriciella sp. TaxID=1968823 RepID=UPI003C732822